MDVISPQEREIKRCKIAMVAPRIFYRRCVKCHYDFRKTLMWAWTEDHGWDDTRRCYGCTTCFTDYQSVISYLGIKE